MKKYLVVDLSLRYHLDLGETADRLGIALLPDCEIVTEITEQIKQDTRKKIVVVQWWYWGGTDLTPIDLSWADLVICYTGELINGPWNRYYQKTLAKFNNANFICVVNGHYQLDSYPKDQVFDQLGYFFSKIANECYYEDWQTPTAKPKLFDALLGITGVAKPHRAFIFSRLKEHNLLDKSFVNAWGEINYTSPELAELDDPAIQSHRHTIKQDSSMMTISGIKNGTSMSHSIPIEIYRQSWYSIVAETGSDNSLFLTEKTAKPLFEQRLFVLFGSQGLLKRLQDQGYQTFGSVIDESYDNEPDNIKRWSMAFDQVLALANSDPHVIYQKLEPVLAHNYTRICNHASRLVLLKDFLNAHIYSLDNIPTK